MAERTSVILGATSALGQAVARALASRDEALVLIARDARRLERVAADLRARGASVAVHTGDFDDLDTHASLLDAVGEADDYWLFYGTLPDQHACEQDWEATAAALHTNFTSAASLLTRIANRLEPRGSGCIVVVSSVAGDRGRGSNYVYGAAKGALSLFCQGLRNRLSKHGVQVTTIKPGFIDTPMTAGIEKKPAPLWATPERVAADMVRARDKGGDVKYTPWFWLPIMLIIKSVPERIFKRLSL